MPGLLASEEAFNGEPVASPNADAHNTDSNVSPTADVVVPPASTAVPPASSAVPPASTAIPLPGVPTDSLLPVDMATVHLHHKQESINAAVLGFRDQLLALSPNPVVSMDAEWDTVRNGRGDIIGKKGRVALVILSARVAPATYKTLLLRTHDKATLPTNLVQLLVDQRFHFTGRCIGGDLSKLSKDFSCEAVHSTTLTFDLGPLARSRNLVPTGNSPLDEIVLAATGYALPKDPSVRCSVWSARTLDAPQLEYAARDGVGSIMA